MGTVSRDRWAAVRSSREERFEVVVNLREVGGGAATPAMAAIHHHEDCGSRERLWLPKERGAEASAARHPYCVACGTVKSLALPRAKPLGYYLSGLASLKRYLDSADRGPKLAQVQSHLIATRLAARPEFADPYGTPGPAQIEAYARIVRQVRPDLDEEVVLRLLPRCRARDRYNLATTPR
jgi:hypothetical protein